jgi:hypothetical protein
VKKTLLCAVISALAVLSSFGQGSVIFSNIGGEPVTLADGITRVPIGSTYQVELMFAPDGTVDFDSMAVRQGNVASFGGLPGYFSGGGRTVEEIRPAGGYGLFQVRAWSTAYGTSYTGVYNSGQGSVGKSNIVRADTSNPLIGDAVAGLVWQGLQGFSITPVPEPSAIALALLAAALFLLHALWRTVQRHTPE